MAFIYSFRAEWSAFPTSIFIISFFANLVLIFAFNRHILKRWKKIRKKVVIVGEGEIGDIVRKRDDVEKTMYCEGI